MRRPQGLAQHTLVFSEDNSFNMRAYHPPIHDICHIIWATITCTLTVLFHLMLFQRHVYQSLSRAEITP
jgi:hypothetical protein